MPVVLSFAIDLGTGIGSCRAAETPPARLVSHVGHVRVRGALRQEPEIPARDGQAVEVGGYLRTLELSLARVRFADSSQLDLRELGTLEILPAPSSARLPILELLDGVLYFFGREPPREVQIRTRFGGGTALGTEFEVAVDEHRAVFTVHHGVVDLTNDLGRVEVPVGFEGVLEPGREPYVRPILEARNILQWWLYYPVVIDPAEVRIKEPDAPRLAAAAAAYETGNLVAALESWPGHPSPEEATTDEGRLLLAALFLGVGHVQRAAPLLALLPADDSRAAALLLLIHATRSPEQPWAGPPRSASEWLALSYLHQARHDLRSARSATESALERSPDFAFAKVRLAELLFGEGRATAARRMLESALPQVPGHAEGHALLGFILAGENRIPAARESFQRSIDLAPGLGNGWLGRGLCRIRSGDDRGGREDLQMAAALESRRALFRSYLGKADGDAGDLARAVESLRRARELDPEDPTPWLYAAVVAHQSRDVRGAIDALLQSTARTGHRRLFRSHLLLDQDRAVGSANLAVLYADAGLQDLSVREARRAVDADYANYSAHLFLANSYRALRDPNLITLRHESAWAREALTANLLAPVGAGALSQQVTHQEYSRLFERDGAHVLSDSRFRSDRRQFNTALSQFGTFGRLDYAVEGAYRFEAGSDGSDDAEGHGLGAKLRVQVGSTDHLLLQVQSERFQGADLFRHRDPSQANAGLQLSEDTEPAVLAGYHRQWSPGQRTLLMVGHVTAGQHLHDPLRPTAILFHRPGPDPSPLVGIAPFTALQDYETSLQLWISELQHITQWSSGSLVTGASLRDGSFDTTSTLTRLPAGTPFQGFPVSARDQHITPNLTFASAYAYLSQDLGHGVRVTAGLTYDHVTYPVNHRSPPISPRLETVDRISPKIGALWEVRPGSIVRAAYAQTQGGVTFENSYSLEPTQISGFNQAFRDLVPELAAGPEVAPQHEIFGFALEQEMARRTFLAASFEILRSDQDQISGGFRGLAQNGVITIAPQPVEVSRGLRFEEQNLSISLHHLLAEVWSVGSAYTRSRATVDADAVGTVTLATSDAVTLDAWTTWLRFHHPSGPFGAITAHAYWQDGRSRREIFSEAFTQWDVTFGYRFPRRRAEIEVGLLNLFDTDYRLSALNYFPRLPRERALALSVRFAF